MRFAIATGVALTLLSAGPTVAQVAQVVPPTPARPVTDASAPVVLPTASDGRRILPAGTEIEFVARREITTRGKQAKAGQNVEFATLRDIVIGGVTVLPRNSIATAELLRVRNQGSGGVSGYIAGQLLTLAIGSRSVPISGKFDSVGADSETAATIIGTVIPFGDMFVSGKRAEIPPGSLVKGKLLVDVDFTGPDPRPLPVTVPLAEIYPPAPRP